MYRDFGVALLSLNEAFLFSTNDYIILCIHGEVLWLWSSYNSAGWKIDGKTSVQSIGTMHVGFSSPNAACMCVLLYPCQLCLCGISLSETDLKACNSVNVIDV